MYHFSDYGIIYILTEIIILKFNLIILEELAEGNDTKFNWLLYKWWRDRDIIYRRNDQFKLLRPLTGGSSFLLNPDGILLDKTTEPAYITQYIKLAGRRDLFLYKQYEMITLPLSYFTDINLTNIKTNPLLTITNTEIHFKYEKQLWH